MYLVIFYLFLIGSFSHSDGACSSSASDSRVIISSVDETTIFIQQKTAVVTIQRSVGGIVKTTGFCLMRIGILTIELIQCTFLNVASKQSGASAVAIVSGVESECPRLIDENLADIDDQDKNSNAQVKVVFARPYLVDSVKITESEDGAESENIELKFSDGTKVQITLSPGSNDPEKFSFAPRVVSWIKLVEKTKYESGITRFTEVEVYYGGCFDAKICHSFELKTGSMETPQYQLGPVLHFMRDRTTRLNLNLSFEDGTLLYNVRVAETVTLYDGASTKVDGPMNIPGATGDAHWIPLWVDLRDSRHIVVGSGGSSLINYDTGGVTAFTFGKFVLQDPSSGEKLVVCNNEASCYKDATHYWPLDKAVSNMVYDAITKNIAKATSPVAVNIDGPPLASGKRTSVVLERNSIDLGVTSACINSFDLCSNGLSISLWLKIRSLTQTSAYYVVGGSSNAGFSILSPSEAARLVASNVLEIEFQDSKRIYRASAPLSLGNWHHIGCSWSAAKGLLCLVDMVVLDVIEGPPLSQYGTATLGVSTTIPNSYGNASYSSFAIWERKLSRSEFQSLYYCMGIKPRSGPAKSLGITSYRLPDESFTASTFTENGKPYFVRTDLGGWTSKTLDAEQFLQIDFFALMEVHGFEMEGNSSADAFVKTFTLSQSKNAIAWTPYKADDGSIKVLNGNTLSSVSTKINLAKNIVTRYLRINPQTYKNRISMKLEVFGKETYANYFGCLPASSLKRSDLFGFDSNPFDCTLSCGQQNKPYALLFDGGECYCPTSVETTGAVDASFCQVPCNTRKMLTCGGRNNAAAFKTVELNNQTFEVSAPLWTEEYEEFNITLISSEPTTFQLYINKQATSTENSYFSQLFEDTGYKSVVAEATTGEYAQTIHQAIQSIYVVEKAKSLSVSCPKLVLASKSYDCVLKGFTGVMDVFNYTINAVQLGTPILSGSFIGKLGVLQHPVAQPDDTQRDILFISSFIEPAVLSSVELHAQKSGFLTVQVFRPVCGTGLFREYCDVDKSCSFYHPVCDEESGFECSEDKVLHLSSGQCLVENTLACDGWSKVPRFIPKKYQKYEVIYENRVFAGSGLNHYELTDDESVHVREHDIIGVIYPAENAASLSIESASGYEVIINRGTFSEVGRGDYIEVSDNYKVIHVRHSLKATYFIPQTMLLPFSLPPGRHHVAIDLRNNVNQFHFSETVVSGIPVEGISWALDAIVATHDDYVISVQVTAGTNITFVVTYDDGSIDKVFQENVSAPVIFSHAYTSPDYKFLELHVYNDFSEEVTNHMLLVQDYIKDVNLSNPVKPTKINHITSIDWYVDSGSRVNIVIDLGDNTTYLNESLDIPSTYGWPVRHVYPSPIEFWVNITAYNLVNRIQLYFMIIVENPIVQLTSSVIHANRDIEVNETVLIKLSQLSGTNVIHHFQFQDGSTLLTRETDIHKNYSYWNDFAVNITAWNNVTLVTWIQMIKVHKPVQELAGFRIATSPTNHTDTVKFYFDMGTGSDFNCTWDFNDGLFGQSAYWITDDQVYKWPITHQVIRHIYANIGVYYVHINCSNRLYQTSAHTVSIVQVPISGFEVDQPPPQPNDEDLVVDFRAATGTNISYTVTFYHTWEKRNIEITDMAISSDTLTGRTIIPKEHYTNVVGLYVVKITAINLVTPLQVITRTVIVDRPIRDAFITIHALYVETNHTVNYTIFADASNVTITWDFNDPAAEDMNIKEKWFQGVFSSDGWTVWHKFDHSGFYQIKVRLLNSLGSKTVTKQITGQFGVYLATMTDSPRPLPPGRMNFTFYPLEFYEGNHPTDAQMVMNFGDGKSYSGPYKPTVIHFYEGWGMFDMNCTIQNQISWGFFTVEVEIQRKIQGLKLTPFHSDGDAGYFGPARGPSLNRLPLEYDVIWNVTTMDGTNITYTFDYGDGDSEVTSNATVFHKYPRVDYYTATVYAKNAISDASQSFTIRIQQIVKEVGLWSDCPRKLGDTTTFRVTIGQVGTESCYLLRFGNNSQNYLFKDNEKTICEQMFVDLADRTEVFTGNAFNVTYTYGYIDVYAPLLTGSNLVSKNWIWHKAVVVHDHCRYPAVDIFNIGRNRTLAPDVLRSQVFMVDTQNVIICDASKTTSFLWETYLVSPQEGVNDTLFSLPSTTAVTNPRFRIDPRVLPYGLYRFRFIITMLGIEGVEGHDDAYLKIVESPMIVVVKGGTGMAKGVDQNVTLDASGSQDPDVGPQRYENITITWRCMATPMESSQSDITTKQAGCSWNNFTLLKTGPAENLVYLPTNFTKLSDVVYSLKLMVQKNHRRSFTYFNIYTKPTETLPVYVKCLQNCKKKRITAVKMAYEGGIRGVTQTEELNRISYEWKLFRAREIGRGQKIDERNWDAVDDFSEMVLTTTETATVVISEKMLWPEFRYRLRLNVIFDEREGFAEAELFINQPPSEGQCMIEPSQGYALDTDFRVSCSGWTDQDMPLSYKFAYRASPDDFESLIYFGSKSETPPIKLPLGKKSLNYSLSVIIDAADSFLAASVTVLNVTVVTKPIANQDDFENEMKNLISQNGSLGNMMASGDAHSAAQLTGSLSSILDEQAEKANEPGEEVETEEELDIENMTPEELEELEKKKKEKEEAARMKKEREKQARIEMRKTMESTLATIPIDSVEAIREKAAATAMISNTPDEVTEDMQDSAMNSAMEMISFLGNSTQSDEPPNPQDTFNAAGGLMSTLGNAMDASIETGARYNDSVAEEGGNSTKTESASKALVNKAMGNVESLASAVLSQKFTGEPPTEVKTDRLSMAVQRSDPSSLGKTSSTTGGGSFLMPDSGVLLGVKGNSTSGLPPVDTKTVSNTKNPFAWDPSASKVKSKVMTMELKNATGHPIKVSNLSKPIDMWVPRSMSVNFTLYSIAYDNNMLYRAFTVVENDTSIQVEIHPEDNNTELIAYLRYGSFPREDLYDFKFLVPKGILVEEEPGNATQSNRTLERQVNPFILFRSNKDLNETAAGKYYIGIKYNGTFEPVYEAQLSDGKVKYKQYIPPKINFTMRTFTSSCLYWDTDNNTWSSDGCTVGPKTAMEGTQCLCTHLTSFGGDMVVAPNTIDWSAITLDNLFQNPVVFAVVLSFIFMYFILLIPARRQDKKDLEKLGVVPLPDNDPRDSYAYEITVYTGFSAQAGTTADVYFVLKGSLDETPVRRLKDPSKSKFSVGSINYFLLTTPSSMGKLKNLRIWHDNGGNSPSWYLLRVMVHDLQRDTKTWFLCDRWLAVEEDDGAIERNLRLATAEDLTKFNLLFQTEARKNLSDGHIWFSVIKRPARSNFTRVQRLSCCLCILLTTMLANAMFYQNDPSTSSDKVLKVGPFSFSLQQLSIAITSSMVVLPVNLFVVWIFRNTPPKKNTKSKTHENGIKPRRDTADPEKNDAKSKKKADGGKKKPLPYWMNYVAYVLIFIACLVSATFTVFYGLTFGKAKSEAWISAMMLSFWQDVLVSQPLKVFAAATLFALITKDPKKATGEDKEDTMPSPELQQDEEFTSRGSAGLMSMARVDPKPIDPEKLQACRELKLKQRQMKLIIYDVIWYFVFLSVLLSVAHGNKDKLAYDTTSTMSSLFEENSYTNWISLSEVTDAKLYWYWSRYSLMPTLIPSQWYGPNQYLENVVWVSSDPGISRSRGARSRLNLNKIKMRKLQGRPGEFPDVSYALNGTTPYPENYVADRATDYTVGVARYRQLRIKPNQCTVQPIFKHMFSECNTYYSWEKEDEGNYFPGWTPEPRNETHGTNQTDDEEATEKQKNAWQYYTAWELKGTPYWAGFSTYWGGGFVADLGHNESLAMNMTAFLQNNNWLDRYTRAIFIEFTIYNPNVNLFCVVTLLSEIIPTGAYYQYNQIYPMRLYRYFGSNLLAIMVLEITLMTFLLYFAYREFKKWRREGRLYWKDIWSYMELLVLASCFSTIGLYFARMVATNYSIGLMRDDPKSFVSFHYATTLDQWSTFTLGMAVFLSFMKTLSLLRFNRRMSFMGKTLKLSWKPLSSFFVVYLVVFLAYATLGFLVFGRVATDYHTFHSSMANILGMTLGAFNFRALVDAHNIIGPVFFFTFTFVVNFILINVFVAIICENLAAVTSDAQNQSNDHEMIDFMWHQFKSFIGHHASPAIKPVYKEPLTGLDDKLDKIEKKSENVEIALRNLCMEEIRQMSWLDPENCNTKKKMLVQLLIHAEEQLTEAELCDGIPLLEEVLATYSEKDIKNWLGEYGVQVDDSGSCRSSILFSRATFFDSDEDSDDSDQDSDNSLREGRWSQLSNETNQNSSLPSISEHNLLSPNTPASRTGTAECYYRYNERPCTAEFFCRSETSLSMTSLNDGMADVERMLQEGNYDGERLFMDESENGDDDDDDGEDQLPKMHIDQKESLNETDKESEGDESDEEIERMMKTQETPLQQNKPHGGLSPSRNTTSLESRNSWRTASSRRSKSPRESITTGTTNAERPHRAQALFQQSRSPRKAKDDEHITVEEFSD